MQTRTYNFYTTSSQANAANIQILAPGYIHMICWSCNLNGTADNDNMIAELSFLSTLGMNTHNAPGIIDTVRLWQNFVTSGMDVAAVNKVCNGVYIPVAVGQIIYLNTSITGAANVQALMHVIER